MPSFDLGRYASMAQQLVAAADAQDWARVAQLDALVCRWVNAADISNLSAPEQEAWMHIAHAHAHALQACQCAKQEAATQIQQLQHSQEAQKAYAWQEVLV
jgi:hypothetical protein